MKKKALLIFILLVCTALFIYILLACTGFFQSSSVSQEEYNAMASKVAEMEKENAALNAAAKTAAPEDALDIQIAEESNSGKVFDETTVLSQLEVNEYHYYTNHGGIEFLFIKNNSEFILSLDISGTFYDKDKKLIGADSSQYANAFEPGQEMAFRFYNDDPFDSFQYQINASEEDFFKPVLSDLSMQISITGACDKAIVSVTNEGDKTAVLVRYFVFFKNNEQIFDYAEGVIGDNNNEIKPGKTEVFDASPYAGTFDSVQVYLSGAAYLPA